MVNQSVEMDWSPDLNNVEVIILDFDTNKLVDKIVFHKDLIPEFIQKLEKMNG